MANERHKNSNELILSDGEYAYTQDTASGIIKVHSGPLVINVTGQEIPVVYNAENRRFARVALEQSRRQSPLAPQGFYCVLWNPAETSQQPEVKSKSVSPELSMGQRVNIPGPCTFPLWPRQAAKVIEGHHLRSNQYLLVRIYDEEAARAHWGSAVIKPAAGADGEEPLVEVTGEVPRDLSVGKLFVIRGTEVSFYIPPTGVEVVEADADRYVREAVTLERLEYAILIDENGNKRYERGPSVVFPRPTEHFYEEQVRERRVRVFRPIELNAIQGIHVKVIADYNDETTGKRHTEGEELFITGKDTPIYFPRQEHSLVSYDGRSKHFATAVPAGEARYVMERQSGQIRMIAGPTMLLPNPCHEVIVRRALNERQCCLWYPGNDDARAYNQRLRELASRAPTTRTGAISEGQVRRTRQSGGHKKKGMKLEHNTAMESSQTHVDVPAIMADEFSRGSTFTEPRTLTLHTRFAGVPTLDIWTGYAVMIVNKRGERRVEIGPRNVILEYDEDLEVLTLSRGCPKTPDKTTQTVYLRMRHNNVSDRFQATTLDHVRVTVSLTLRVDFEGEDPKRWFSVENYVQAVCDRARAVIKARVRQEAIEALYPRAEDVLRGALLGEPDPNTGQRQGLVFEDFGARVVDVDIQSVAVEDERVASLLDQAQQQAVQSGLRLATAQRQLEIEKHLEAIARERAAAQAETARHQAELEGERIQRDLSLALSTLTAETREHSERLNVQLARDAVANAGHDASLARKEKNADFERRIEQATQQLRVALLDAETQATVQRLGAAQEGFSEALLALGNQDTLVKVAEALSVQQLLGGRSLPEVLGKVFESTPLEDVLQKVQRRAALPDTK